MAIKIDGTPFVLPTNEEARALVKKAFDNAQVPVQESWVNHQMNRVEKKLAAFLECLGPIGVATTGGEATGSKATAKAGK